MCDTGNQTCTGDQLLRKDMEHLIEKNLETVRRQMELACQASGRKADEVKLLCLECWCCAMMDLRQAPIPF